MDKILDKINLPKDLKDLKLKEKEILAEELRKEIIKDVSKTGGHLLLGPTPAGVVAGLPCLITAVILIHFMKKDEQK